MNEVLCGSLAERRRLEIIEAAERCVMKTGLHRLTLRDIAREQGGSLGNIYNYFANKEEIVEPELPGVPSTQISSELDAQITL